MSNSSIPEQPIDPELNDLLDLLRIVPDRDPEKISKNRQRYMSQLDSVFQSEPISITQRLASLLPFNKMDRIGSPLKNRFAYSFVLSIMLITVILLSGAGATAFASQAALPGDALFAVKTGLEETRIRLANNAAVQAQLHLQFAERRLDELSELVLERRYEDIERATIEFEFHVNQAIQALQVVSAGDPVEAQDLAAQITGALSRYAQILMELTAGLPERVQESIIRAMNLSQSASEMHLLDLEEYQNTGSQSNDNDQNYDGLDGSRSPVNEAVIGEENGNGNVNPNSNHNSNTNSSQEDQNENEDRGYSNENAGNDNDDDDHESGSNRNESNDNDNHNENDNDDHNDNDNDNDDHGDNNNDHDNQNDNDFEG